MVQPQLGVDLLQVEVEINSYAQRLHSHADRSQYAEGHSQRPPVRDCFQYGRQREHGKGQQRDEKARAPGVSRPPQIPGRVKGHIPQHGRCDQQGLGPVAPEEHRPANQGGEEDRIVPEDTLARTQGQPVKALKKWRGESLLRQIASIQRVAKAEPVIPGGDYQRRQHREPVQQHGPGQPAPGAPVLAP